MIRRTGSHGLGQSPKSLNNFHIAVSALLSFAVKRSYAMVNPFDPIDKVRVPAKAPGILTPEDCQNLLNAAGDDILPLVSIQAFCGVRSAETLRLNWSDVYLARGFVQIAAEQAKGARRRLVEMPANLKACAAPRNVIEISGRQELTGGHYSEPFSNEGRLHRTS
jgi:integrase